MPVLVTAADTPLGARLVHRLLATGGQVRAYCSAGGNVSALRAAGAIAASGDLDDEGRLEAACEQVHTVIHLAGGLLTASPERLVADTATLATATANAGVSRVILLSVVGASGAAGDALRRAKSVAEQVVADSAPPSISLRVPLVEAPGLRDVLAGTPLPPDVGDHDVRSIRPEEVVDLLVALDELRSSTDSGHATLVAQGDSPRPLRQWIAEAASTRGTYRRLESLPLLVDGLRGPWTDEDAVAADAWAFTGVDRAAP